MTIAPSFVILPASASGLPSFVFDAYEEESHTRAVVITEHPLETGSTVADHVIEQLPEFSVTGHVTNTPIRETIFDGTRPGIFASGVLSFSGERDFAREALELLEKYQANRVLLEVATGMKTYTDMLLREVKTLRSGAAKFSLTFKQIKIVSTANVKAPKPLLSVPHLTATSKYEY
jgi:D-tyrosyl-tRNA(Tyr) deacylase